jgi:type VI protein secretion system component Hcp
VLNQALIFATNYPSAVIEICRVGTPTQECFLRIELGDVQIASLNISGSVCGASGSCTPSVTESLTLRFHKIAWIFTPYVGGEAGTPVRRCFNVDTNASCP